MSNESQKPTVATEPEIGSNDVGHSNMHDSTKGGAKASPEELALAYEMSQKQIAALKKELADQKAKSGDSSLIKELATLLASSVQVNKPIQQQGPMERDNINRSREYREFANNVDGQYVIDAQTRLTAFRHEEKKEISIPKQLASTFGPSLTISVNGVRVSIPCDGKTYRINKTHWRHAKERMAKVDRIASDDKPTVIEIEA